MTPVVQKPCSQPDTDACDTAFPFTVLQDLLETQTIPSCSHIFSWIEARASRLTTGMAPQKGKALTLLRTLNDLLRRLSKMGSTTLFCGRISTFLSGVFPLGERSGVNLRGEYGPVWEGVMDVEHDDAEMDVDMKEAGSNGKSGVDDKSDGESKKRATEVKDYGTQCPSFTFFVFISPLDFYKTFWSLQHPFSRPPLFAVPETFNKFKDAVEKVLPVIKEATTKDRAMMGNRTAAGQVHSLKRKRESGTGDETNTSDYFFAKFLTNPDLLSLEVPRPLALTVPLIIHVNFSRSPIHTFDVKYYSSFLSLFNIFLHSPKLPRRHGQHPAIALFRWISLLSLLMLNGSRKPSQRRFLNYVPQHQVDRPLQILSMLSSTGKRIG